MPEWIGKTIGKVRIEKLLARGGMAEVYLGTHLTLERPVAVKLLHSHIEEEPSLLERFHREAKVVAGLRHPNIVQIFDFDTVDGHPYIVMEYLRGPTLASYLRSLHDRDELIPPHQVARLLKGLTAALDYAHAQGVIHRDIKPGNILLHNRRGEIALDKPLANDVDVVITDFGLVRIAHAATQTASGMVSGTPAYMSPEQASGEKVDHCTDIYSLGVVLYEMLAGRVPFDADSTMSVLYMQIHNTPPPIKGISSDVQAIMNRALMKNPEDRYQTSSEMAVDFYLAIGMTADAKTIIDMYPENAELTAAVAKPKPTPTPARRRSWLGVGIFAFICTLLLGAGVWGLSSFLPSLGKASQATSTSAATSEPVSSLTVPVTGDLPAADGMVKVTSGSYEVGYSPTPADNYHTAPQVVPLSDFWIDQYLITNQQYQQFMTDTGGPAPQNWPGEPTHPVIGVTWEQAQAYCQSIKKRLPSEAEWEAAGRGPGVAPRLYPWGNDVTAEGQANRLPDESTYSVGTQSFNQSPFKVFDMVGNVWEWVGDPYASVQAGYRILRGGRYSLPINDLAYRLVIEPDDTRYVKFAGFRCATNEVR